MNKTQIGANGTPLLTRISEALKTNGATVRPPAMPQGIDLKGYISPGAVPVHLRGMMDLYLTVERDAKDMADMLETRARNCRAGDCACRKAGKNGVEAEIAMLATAKTLFKDLAQVGTLLAPALEKSLNGFDISEQPFVVASDWRIMTPRADDMSGLASAIAEAIRSGSTSLNLLVLRIDGKSVTFDPKQISDMDANALKAHIVSKLTPATAAKLDRDGAIEGLVTELALVARIAMTDSEAGRDRRPRNPFAGFGSQGFDFETLVRGFGRAPRRHAGEAVG